MDVVEQNRTFLYLDEIQDGNRNPPTACRTTRQAEPYSGLLDLDGDGNIIYNGDVIISPGFDDGVPEVPSPEFDDGQIVPVLRPAGGFGPGPIIRMDVLTFPDFKDRTIISWDGQNFAAYSSWWEQEFSTLIQSMPPIPCRPVLDECGLVVGYYFKATNTKHLSIADHGELMLVSPFYPKGKPFTGQNVWLTSTDKVVTWTDNKELSDQELANLYHQQIPSGSQCDVLVDIEGYVLSINMYDPDMQSTPGASPLVMLLGLALDATDLPDPECAPGGKLDGQCDFAIVKIVIFTLLLVMDGVGIAKSLAKNGPKLLKIARRAPGALKAAARRTPRALLSLARNFPKAVKRLPDIALIWTKNAKFGKYIAESGMAGKHFRAAQHAVDQLAKEGKELYVLFRPTNPKSVQWIEKGFPPKGLNLKIKTSKFTGIVTASEAEYETVFKEGYYVISKKTEDGAVALHKVGGKIEEIEIKKADWTVEPGQVIEPKTQQPFVGDYDLLSVIDAKGPGRNLTSVSEGVKDFTDPLVNKFRERFNAQLDRPRSLHGPQDKLVSEEHGGLLNEGAVLFRPNQDAAWLPNQTTVEQFYSDIRRPTVMGSHNRPGQGFQVGKKP